MSYARNAIKKNSKECKQVECGVGVRLGVEEAGVLNGPQGVVVGPRVDGREVQRVHQHRHVIHLRFGIAFFCARVVPLVACAACAKSTKCVCVCAL
jgi:hypothetical protein